MNWANLAVVNTFHPEKAKNVKATGESNLVTALASYKLRQPEL